MMAALAFFLLGLPLVWVASRLVVRLTDFEEEPGEAGQTSDAGMTAERKLPWQKEPWLGRVRWGVLAAWPPLMAVAAWRFDPGQAVVVSLLLGALLICTATDLLRYRVPNVITYPAIVLALIAGVVLPGADLTGAVAAALVAGGVFFVLAMLTRGGLGLGDVKLAVLIGAMLGMPVAVQSLLLGVIAGGVVIFALFLAGVVGRREPVPYAPFLALAAIAVVLIQGAAFAPL